MKSNIYNNKIYNKILVIYIIKLIRKYNYLNGKPYSSKDIYRILTILKIRPKPSSKIISEILKILKLYGKITDPVY